MTPHNGRWDWAGLKARIARHGLRNSLLVAPMPTASTAQVLGNNESFEPYTQNLYVRRVLSGEFVQVNRQQLRDRWSGAYGQGICGCNSSRTMAAGRALRCPLT